MAGLRRIILIQTHLNGIIELIVDEHTNICGTNASGKTTLQRLIPVFYGERLSNVVPKTRTPFGNYYLPKSNSFIVYEYQAANGDLCQAVLTNSAKDGVQYRFVNAPYDKSQLLYMDYNDKVNSYSPEKWLVRLSELNIKHSHKINYTREYRSIIQNCVVILSKNTKENNKLRHLTAQYSLIESPNNLGHIEKITSAVHAKAGKFDTLKTVLTSIFEEEGIEHPTTKIQKKKVEEWIPQMRHSLRLEELKTQYNIVKNIASDLKSNEDNLQNLTIVVAKNLVASKTEHADLQQQDSSLDQKQEELKNHFDKKEMEINSELSKVNAELTTVTQQLDKLQADYDKYADSDIEQLEQNSKKLPIWINQLDEKQLLYKVLIDEHRDLERELDKAKIKLNDSLQQSTIANNDKISRIEKQREQIRDEQNIKKEELRDDYITNKDKFSDDLEQQITELKDQQSEHKAQLNSGATKQEQEDLDLSSASIDIANDNWEVAKDLLTEQEQSYQQTRQQQLQKQKELEQTRSHLYQLRKELRLLNQQINPENGSLRHYLHVNIDNWENSIGKVINPQLLERTDLHPVVNDTHNDIYGVSLNLSVIDLPPYAEDIAALQVRQEDLENKINQANSKQKTAETALKQANDLVDTNANIVVKTKQKIERCKNEINHAKDAKRRLVQENKEKLDERRNTAKKKLSEITECINKLKQQKDKGLEELKHNYNEQLLEFKSEWQQEIHKFDDEIKALQKHLYSTRQEHKQQIKIIEDAFKQELTNKNIDSKVITSTKNDIDHLEKEIRNVRNREDELRQYQDFIQINWKKLRPRYLEQENTCKAQQINLNKELNKEKNNFKQQRDTIKEQQANLQKNINKLKQNIDSLLFAENKIKKLDLPLNNTAEYSLLVDVNECIDRIYHAIEQYNKNKDKFKDTAEKFEKILIINGEQKFVDLVMAELTKNETNGICKKLSVYNNLLVILENRQQELLAQGETIGNDLANFFDVFSNINRCISSYSKCINSAVNDDLILDEIKQAEVKIISTVDELGFWQPLKRFSKLYKKWKETGEILPSDEYINKLSDIVNLLPTEHNRSLESLLRLELQFNEKGQHLIIKNDKQLTECSSNGMAYLILCKFLLAFTLLLRGEKNNRIKLIWPVDEIGTLSYQNLEKLFKACYKNNISILGAFPNPEADVLKLFKNRYLIDKQHNRLQRIEPKVNPIEFKLEQRRKKQSFIFAQENIDA